MRQNLSRHPPSGSVRKLSIAVAVVAAALANSGSTGDAGALAPVAPAANGETCGALTGSARPRTSHVIVLIFENRDFPQIVGNPDAPTFNRLAAECAVATSYYAVAFSSLRDYMALTGGRAWQSVRKKAR